MDHERWRRLQHLYQMALEREPDQRVIFLAQACEGDDDLRRDIDLLLSQTNSTGGLIGRTVWQLVVGMTEPRSDVTPGTRFGPYEILGSLGEGGMGRVYRGLDTRLDRPVAIKVSAEQFSARFEREARAIAALNHPQICTLYDVGPNYLVMELVEGETLAQRLDRRGALPLRDVLEIGLQVAEALQAAHCKGIVHRDLKPANIKLTLEGRVKVLDFGLAKTVWHEGDEITDAQLVPLTALLSTNGQVLGTPAYMSPEQARGEGVDRRTDIWAFGCLLYELLSGKRAFSGEATAGIIANVRASEPEWSGLPPDLPARIEVVLRRCLDRDMTRRPQEMAEIIRQIKGALSPPKTIRLWRIAVGAAAAGIAALTATTILDRQGARQVSNQWTQVTNLPDSAVQPALSPDGHMLAFIRGSAAGNLASSGQIYIKRLPEGEAIQLTRDNHEKLSPVFSPDGSQIAYGTMDSSGWDTWVVPVAGGNPKLWLPNSSGLVWTNAGHIMFSEIKSGFHMAAVTADENGNGKRDVYVPTDLNWMAHRSYPSPDGKWVLIVEMEGGPWGPCRLVPSDGSTAARRVGPPQAGCTYAAWSPDSKWMYLNSNAGSRFHIWRQRLPDGRPEQITSGPTEEEGIAMAPDGHSFITSVGTRRSVVWLHGRSSDRQLSLEGYAYAPRLTSDGRKLLYRVGTATAPLRGPDEPTALWIAEPDSGLSKPFLPGFSVYGYPFFAYDISPDNRRVVMQALGTDGKLHLWGAALDGNSEVHQIPTMEGHEPLYAADGRIYFRDREVGLGAVYSVRDDGSDLRKLPFLTGALRRVSPDGRWLVAGLPNEAGHFIFPIDGGTPVRLYNIGGTDLRLRWSSDAKLLYLTVQTSYPWGEGRTYMVPLRNGQMFPQIPPGGFRAESDIRKLSEGRVIDSYDVAPGPTPDTYAYSRETVERNLYRIPVPTAAH